jgi:hypothetical protein
MPFALASRALAVAERDDSQNRLALVAHAESSPYVVVIKGARVVIDSAGG